MHKTIIPTAEGYDFLNWLKNNDDFFICGDEAQQHVPVGQISHMESSVHLQSVHEQFCNVSYTWIYVLTLWDTKNEQNVF